MRVPLIVWFSAIIVVLCSTACISQSHRAQVKKGQHPRSFSKEIKKTVQADYLLYIPDEYMMTRNEWPLLLFLHGAGERGDDLSKVEIQGPPKLAAKGNDFPFIIVSPQCPEGDWWSNDLQIDTLNALLDEVVAQHRIDEDRIYVTGLSMGGFGTWRLAAAYPGRFAAMAPICGGGKPADAASIAHLPIWVFHGAKDEVVPIEKSKEMVAALEKAGCKARFTVYPDAGHDSWTATYENPELYEWFLEHTRSGHRDGAGTSPAGGGLFKRSVDE